MHLESKRTTNFTASGQRQHPCGAWIGGVDVAPGGSEICVANAQDGTVSVVDVAAKKVVATLAANVRRANRLNFTPDGKAVLISSLGGSDLAVLDAGTRREVNRVKTDTCAAETESDGARAFVACTPDKM